VSFSQATHQSIHPPSKNSSINNPRVLLQQVFYIQWKKGDGATILWEGCDIVTKNCIPTSLNVNNLAVVLHLASLSSSSHRLLIIHFHKGLISRTYKKLKKLNPQRLNTPIKK
jgi:hypothetical protein